MDPHLAALLTIAKTTAAREDAVPDLLITVELCGACKGIKFRIMYKHLVVLGLITFTDFLSAVAPEAMLEGHIDVMLAELFIPAGSA